MQRRRIISLSVKLTATTVVLVFLVVAIFGGLTLRLVDDSVESQTERLIRIRTDSLDEVGYTTARYLAFSAASPMYDNDLAGLYGLVQPLVEQESGSDVLYAYVVATDGRVWIATADPEVAAFHVGDEADPLYRRTDDLMEPTLQENVGTAVLAPYADLAILPLRQDVAPRFVATDGASSSIEVQQYTAGIIDRNEELLGYLTLAYSLDRLHEEVAQLTADGEERRASSRDRILLLGALAVVLGFIIAIAQALAITRNVKALWRATKRIAAGDLEVRARIRSRDEIGVLGQHFNVMADRVQRLLVETQEKAKMEKELDIARMIQETLLPPPGRIEVHGIAFAGYFRSASVCGGDFWHYNAIGDNELLLTIGDVTGHGVPSAMISAAAKSGLDTLINVSPGRISVPYVVEELNKTIFDTARRALVMTFLALKFEPQAGIMTFANAGHNFPILVRRNPEGKAEARALVARGNRLGDVRTSRYQQHEAPVQVGDVLVLFTDGLTEYQDASGAEYGERRLRRLLISLAHLGPEEILSRVLGDLSAFAGSAPQEDDITLVVAKL